MRCPKCNFVSYDLSEKCVKCGKNISAASKELQGTAASVAAPAFLRFGLAEPEPAIRGSEAESEVTFDLGGEEEAVVEFGTEDASLLESGALDFGGPAVEAPAEEEPVFALPTEEPQAEGFEISDLAPPQEAAEPVEVELVQEQQFAAVEAPSPNPAGAGLGLADLKVEGIDLEAGPAKDKVMHAVKTGTALDEFDIDLNDLLSKK